MEWTSDLDTGIPVIDAQHKRIVKYINMLGHANTTSDREEVEEVLSELTDYTLSHFTFEEGLMEESGYACIAAHKKVHQSFVHTIANYIKRFRTGEDVTTELLTTLKSWLVNHIKGDDADYSEAVKLYISRPQEEKSSWFKRSMKKVFG